MAASAGSHYLRGQDFLIPVSYTHLLLADQGIAGGVIAVWMYIDMLRIQREGFPFVFLLMTAFFLPLFFLTGYSNLTFWMPMFFIKMVSNMSKRNGTVFFCQPVKEER